MSDDNLQEDHGCRFTHVLVQCPKTTYRSTDDDSNDKRG